KRPLLPLGALFVLHGNGRPGARLAVGAERGDLLAFADCEHRGFVLPCGCPFCSRQPGSRPPYRRAMDDAFAAADRFLLDQARLLERRLFATCFLGQTAGRVVDALRGYQNDDGGFGHALEPDTRWPASLPVYIETAFQALAAAGTVDHDMVTRACDFLARAAEEA